MIKRILNPKAQTALKNVEAIRQKPTASWTPDDVKKMVIFLATQKGLIK